MYIRCIDGLRAFAICLVLLAHMIHSESPPFLKDLFSYWNAGTVGVRLFFLISGFLITTILNQEIQKNGRIDIRKFFIRRVLRIFPAFYFYLIVLGLLSYFAVLRIDSWAIVFAFFYIQNLNVFQRTDLFASSALVKHSWSLSVEEQFYVVFPFLMNFLKKVLHLHRVRVMLAMTLVCTFFRALNYEYPDISRMTGGLFFMHCDFLFYGAVVALHLDEFKAYLITRLFRFRYLGLLLALTILVFSSRWEYYSVVHILIFGNLILFSNLYVLLFFLAYPDSWLGDLLEHRMVRAVGKLSYSLYVWQQLFLGSTDEWLRFKLLTVYPYNIILVFFCASCSYLLIERPFLNLKKKYN